MAYRKYSNEQKRQCVQDFIDEKNVCAISARHDIPEATMRNWCRGVTAGTDLFEKFPDEVQNADKTDEENLFPQFDKIKKKDISWRELGEFAKQAQTVREKSKAYQSKVGITIPVKTDRPVAIMYSSDWHLGSVATNYDEFMRHIDKVLETPNLYMVTVGDEIDNFYRFGTLRPIFDQIMPPELQMDMLRGILKELASQKKILAACWGNHTSEFAERAMGFDVMSQLVANKVPYLGTKGIINLKIGDQTYDNLVTHKSRYSSFLNRLHGNKREFQLTHPARVVVTAHTHVPDFETYYHYGVQNFLIKCGTFKIDDIHSMRYYGRGVMGTPTLVYHPGHDHIVPFSRCEDALLYTSAFK